ncbi:MAG: M48 family metallopeptidase, partial [Pseudorhodoplanes sp.]
MAEAATRSGPAVYFDGVTAARQIVTLACTPSGLDLSRPDGTVIAQWPYDRLQHLNAPAQVIRIGLRSSDKLARLEIHDPSLADAIDRACPDIDRTDATARAEQRRAMLWSLAAIVSLLLVALYGVPKIADQIGRLTPRQIDESLGRAGDLRFRAMFDRESGGTPFECGDAPEEAAGKQAFDRLIGRLVKAAGLSIPVHAVVVRREEPNAFALAGGHIYVLKGLIDDANDADEVAAVIAHEIGHVANRDGIRSILQSAGLSLIFGMLLGDFVGGAAVVVAAQMLLKAAYSRQQEAAA